MSLNFEGVDEKRVTARETVLSQRSAGKQDARQEKYQRRRQTAVERRSTTIGTGDVYTGSEP